MSKVFIEETTLTAIGDAIREKTGKTELIAPLNMATEISSITTGGGGGDIEIEPIVLTNNCDYACSGKIASQFINIARNKISTKSITNANHMFNNYEGEDIPFDINITGSSCELSYIFYGCQYLKTLPKINMTAPFYKMVYGFSHCHMLREIPDDYFDNWDWSKCIASTSAYNFDIHGLFSYCYSLRKLPLEWLKNMNPLANYGYTYFYNGFLNCQVLDELFNLPLPYTATWTSNGFSSAFDNCYRLKNITFETNEDGTPKAMNWKSQILDLSRSIGYGVLADSFTNYNSGITADKEVKDDITYQALKNDEDWFTKDINYSRYNRISAVETINSLPDTSAYLATAGGTNTIKFIGASGSLTDGGAINTMTEEEIAVATAKGWTVSFK